MKIIQITDLHLALEGTETRGVNVLQNFRDIISAVKAENPDLLVFTGDIAYASGNGEIYEWVKTQLNGLEIPCRIIAGNHDNPLILHKVFPTECSLTNGELYWKERLGGWDVFFIESSTSFISKNQLKWLENQLCSINRDIVIFMHHPALKGGARYMDEKWSLQNMNQLQNLLFAFPHTVVAFCGHYHVEKTIIQKNIAVHITPSTFFQMKWQTDEFELDHYRIAYREINLRNDGAINSNVVYLDGNIG